MSQFAALASIVNQQGSAAPFSPADVTGMSLWLDASDAATITATGANVTAWADKSSNNYDLTATGTPQTGTRSIGGLNAMGISSGSYFTRANTPINNASDGSWTIFIVCVTDNTTGTVSFIDGDNGTSIRIGQYIRRSSSTLQSIGFTTGGSSVTDSGSTLTASVDYLLRSVNTGTSVEVFANGTSGGSTAAASQKYLTTTPLGVGTRGDGGTQVLTGAIGEIIAYSLDLAAGDITAIESYLTTKWGI